MLRAAMVIVAPPLVTIKSATMYSAAIRPVRVPLARLCLVLVVRGLRAAQGVRESAADAYLLSPTTGPGNHVVVSCSS